MNRIHGIDEGRPFYKLRPTMLAITALTVVLTSAVALTLVVSGPLAQAIGDVIGLGSTAVLVWSIAKWPAVLAVVVLIVALLYYATPNIKQPKFRWISIGATFAILIWIIASAGFGVYVANFSNYDKTYGSLAGVIVFLLWLWITNIALLFGAELDAELERGRQLQAGLPAEETLQLPPRDTTTFEKSRQQHAEDIEEGRRLRLTHGTSTSEQDYQDEQDGVTMSRTEKKTGTSAKILYRPVGLISSVVAGIVAGQVFKQVWKRATPGDQSDAPQPLESEYNLRQVLIAATIQGAIFAAVKALVDRGGATVFEKWTGEWPGD